MAAEAPREGKGRGNRPKDATVMNRHTEKKKRKLRRQNGESEGEDEVFGLVARRDWEQHVKSLPKGEERLRYMAECYVKMKRMQREGRFCSGCWLQHDKCCCSFLGERIQTNATFLLYMHYKEYMRCSNTAKLILRCLTNSSLYLFGIKEDEEALKRKIDENRSNTFLLFPSTDSMSFEQFVNGRIPSPKPSTVKPTSAAKEDENDAVDEATDAVAAATIEDTPPVAPPMVGSATPAPAPVYGPRREGPYTVIIVDGTWGNAKTLNHTVAGDIPRVIITPQSLSLFAVMRTQSQPDRICTMEAVCMLLQDMGYPRLMSEELIRRLKISIDASLNQTATPPAYGTDFTAPAPPPLYPPAAAPSEPALPQ